MGADATGDTADMRADSHIMVAFEGTRAPLDILTLLARGSVPGITLFRPTNVDTVGQVRELTQRLQAAAGTDLPLLIAADQETGQLMGLGAGTTPFPGAMALGATGDTDLARRVAQAVGTEMRAMGVTMNYAPVCDVATNPTNPSLGIRAFSDDPSLVSVMVAATVAGLTAAGVAATAKHFPGKGEAVVDPHLELPLLELNRERLDAVELAPFRAAIEAGVPALMVGHYGLPSVTGVPDLPTSVSPAVVEDLLRRQLGFEGVVITDALDMGALPQGVGQIVDTVAALRAGTDLLLCTPDDASLHRLRTGLDLAVSRSLLPDLAASRQRIARLRGWLGGFTPPDTGVVGSRAHRDLADEVARRSVTLVKDETDRLPLRPYGRLLAVMPRPSDLTPADTSSMVEPPLAAALRRHHPAVDEVVTEPTPTPADIAGVRAAVETADVVVIGTISAGPEQASLVEAVLATGRPTVTVALRTPFDLASYPAAPAHLCTYSILEPSMNALTAVLFGQARPSGVLPAAIPGLFPRGHGLVE